jgi:Nucleotidyltransferase domain
MTAPPTLPALHARFLAEAVPRLAADARLVGVAAGGSYAAGALDEFSDLDLVIVAEAVAYDEVMGARQPIASGLGSLLVAFTGEHVGEPRLLVCLYGPPLLHVDLKFVRLADLAERVEDPVVLWQRGDRLGSALASGTACYPAPDFQAIEDRFWVLVHYVATKIGRGELLEAVDALSFMRYLALGPLALAHRGGRPTGVRKLEYAAPDLAQLISATVATCDAHACLAALEQAIACYRQLREETPSTGLRRHADAEAATVAFVRELASCERR